MALRSLFVKLKALQHRLPGSGFFARAPKDVLVAKTVPRFQDAAKYGSTEEFSRCIKAIRELRQKVEEENKKKIRRFHVQALMLSIVGGGSLGLLKAHYR